MPETYDAFVSYKSENANEVRGIVETMLANGVKVWFAEYFVLLENYDEFQSCIDAAIDASEHAILFTNEAWARSDYCQLEVLRLARRLEANRTLRVHAADHPQTQPPRESVKQLLEWIQMAAATTAHSAEPSPPAWAGKAAQVAHENAPFVWTDLEPILIVEGQPQQQALDAVRRWLDRSGSPWKTPPALRTGPNSRWSSELFGISIEPGVFSKETDVDSPLFSSHEIAGLFLANIDGVSCTFGIQVNPFESAIGDLAVPAPREPGEGLDDRAVYTVYRRYALDWLAQIKATAHGLHLFHWKDAKGHRAAKLGLTYVYPGNLDENEAWERRYSVNTHDPVTGDVGEVNLMFKAELPRGDRESAARAMAHLTPYFEAIASTLQVHSMTGGSFATWLAATVKAALALGLATLLIWILQRTVDVRVTLSAAVLLGVGLADLVLFSCWPRLRKVWAHLGTHTGRLNQSVSLYERVTTDTFDNVVKCAVFWILVVYAGVVDWVGAVAVSMGLYFALENPAYWVGVGLIVGVRGTSKRVHQMTRKTTARSYVLKSTAGSPTIRDGDQVDRSHPDQLCARFCDNVSPYLTSLIAESRRLDRGFLEAALRPWFAGCLGAGAMGLYGYHVGGGLLLAGVIVLVAVMWLVAARLAVPTPVVLALRAFRQEPTSEVVSQLAATYDQLGQEGGVIASLARAVQWSTLLCQHRPDDWRAYCQLANSACSLSRAIAVRVTDQPAREFWFTGFFTSERARRARYVAFDALVIAERHCPSKEAREIVDRLKSVCSE